MPDMKITFFFAARERGWTESYFRITTDTDLNAVVTQAELVAELRAQMLGKEARIFAIRASNEDVKNDSYLRYKDFKNTDANPRDCADLDIAILARLANFGFTRFKNVFLRGFWDSLEVNAGQFIGPGKAAFTDAFNNWIDRLKRDLYAWKSQPATGANADIQTYTTPADGLAEITTKTDLVPPAVVGAKNLARISGVNGKSALNGQQLVEVTAVNKVKLVKPLALLPYVFGGRIKLSNKTIIPIETAQAQKIVPRKSGAPLLATRGRRPARARG